MKDCELNKEHIKNYDWEGINLIINSLFNCFGKVTANKRVKIDAQKDARVLP